MKDRKIHLKPPRRPSLLMGIVLLLICFLPLFGFAADVKVSLSPQLISFMDRSVLKIEYINTKGEGITLPKIDGLEITYQGKQQKTILLNGHQTSSLIYTYIVTPAKVGDFDIGPILCKYKGKTKKLSVKLRVTKPTNDKEAQTLSDLLFSKVSSNRSAPYIHESFTITVKIFIRDGIRISGSFELRGGMPENGIDGDYEWKITDRGRETINGKIFKTHTLQTTIKTLRSGTFSFSPEVQLYLVIPREKRRSTGFSDPFFGDLFGITETHPVTLDCNTIKVKVQPIPMKGRPKSYTGGVGVFDFHVEIGPKKVKAGDPITIKTKISGRGNLNQITAPKISTNSDLKWYDARVVPSKVPGVVCFEQVLIPSSSRIKEIPKISFSYFNSTTGDFRTLTQGPFPVTVEAASNRVAQLVSKSPTKEHEQPKVEIIGRDIVYLKPAPKTWTHPDSRVFYKNQTVQILLLFPLFLLLLVSLIMSRREKLKTNPAFARRQKAPKAARKNIQRARKALHKNDDSAFYEALWIALADYFGHRLNLPPGEITLQAVQSRLPQENEALELLFNRIEQHRYARGETSELSEKKQLLKQLETTLRQCERMKL